METVQRNQRTVPAFHPQPARVWCRASGLVALALLHYGRCRALLQRQARTDIRDCPPGNEWFSAAIASHGTAQTPTVPSQHGVSGPEFCYG